MTWLAGVVVVAAGAHDDEPAAPAAPGPGHKNGHSARPSGARGGQQPRRGGGKRSKRGSKSS